MAQAACSLHSWLRKVFLNDFICKDKNYAETIPTFEIEASDQWDDFKESNSNINEDENCYC